MSLTLTWKREPTPRLPSLITLWAPGFSSPLRADGAIGHVVHQVGRTWRAEAQVDHNRTTWVLAGSRRSAQNRLEAVLHRQSIGWFGEDDLIFEPPEP